LHILSEKVRNTTAQNKKQAEKQGKIEICILKHSFFIENYEA